MKKFIVFFFLLISVINASACDICGCGPGNYYMGLLPQFSHRFVGMRFQYRNFHTRLTDDPTQFSHDQYKTIELWGGMNVGRRWQFMVLAPFVINHQVSDEGIKDLHGIGDITLLANYKLLDITGKAASGQRISQQWWIGGGVKAPTGHFSADPSDPDLAASANTQTGTGSTDFLLTSSYNLRLGKWGIQSNASWLIDTKNSAGYQFGNKLSLAAIGFYTITTPTVVFTPNAGLQGEHSSESRLNKEKIELTGGEILNATAGLEIGFRKLSLGVNVQLPVSQQFANGQTKELCRAGAHISLAF